MSSQRRSRGHREEVYAFSSDDDDYPVNFKPSPFSGKKYLTPKMSSRKGSTVSLLDFDRDYTLYSSSSEPQSHSRSRVKGHGVTEMCSQCVRWVQSASTLKLMLLGVVLGLVFAIFYQTFVRAKGSKGSDNLLPCPSDDELCIKSAELPLALSLARKFRESVHIRAGLFDCGDKSVPSRNVTLRELTQQLSEEFSAAPLLRNTMYLIIYNPHWGVRWLDKDGINKTRWNLPDRLDILDSTQPLLPWQCHITLTIGSLWSYVRSVLLILVACVLLVGVVGWYMLWREQEKKNVFLMVERIIDVLKKHYHACSKDADLLPYLAIIHVRDTLIPPSERKRKEGVWRKACEWISKNDSRVRVENRRIAGEDFLVWRWIQNDPPKTEEPVSVVMDTPDLDKGRGKNWSPWTALDHYGPRGGEKVAPPIGTPSPFIRLKNMFDVVRMDDEQAKQIENSVLEKCTPHGPVVHIYVDRKSTFGCVYFKMGSLDSAAKAYRALHGGWYNGKLVTAKYIEEARYLKWFPQSADAKVPLRPS